MVRMMRHAHSSRLRSLSYFRPLPQVRSVSQLRPSDLWPGEEEITSTLEQVLESVRTRAITSQDAVQRMTSFAKNKPEQERRLMCAGLWKKSFETARKSAESAAAIAEFLGQLSYQSQRDHDDWDGPRGSVPGPIMIETDHGHREHLWHDLPGMWCELESHRTDGYPTAAGPNRKAEIDRLLKDRYFISVLSLSTSPTLQQLWSTEIFSPFEFAAEWPPVFFPRREDVWEVWVPALVVQMKVAGTEMKDRVLSTTPWNGWGHLGWWLRWQRRLSAIAADETIDAEFRATAKQAHDMMTIDRNLTNRWWREHRDELSDIAASEGYNQDERITALVTKKILAAEDAEMSRKR